MTILALLSACTDSPDAENSPASAPAASIPPLPAGVVPVATTFGLTTPTSLGGNFPLSKPAPTGKHVCFVQNGNQYTELFQRGVEEAVKPLGWTLTVIQANQAVASSYGTAITSSLQAGCDGVIQPSALYANYEGQVPSAMASGMIIEDANTANTVGQGVVQVLNANQYQYYEGVATANAVLQDIAEHHPTGKVLIQNVTVPQFQSVFDPILAGFSRQIAVGCGSRCTIKVITDDLSVVTGSNPSAPFVAAVQKNPDTDYLIPPGFTDSGIVASLQQAGLKPPTIIGTSPLQSQLKDLQSEHPTSVAWVAEDFITNGWFMVDGLVRYWAGETEVNPWAKVPGLIWAITRDNVAQYIAGGGEQFPANYRQLFQQMWKPQS